MSYHGDIRLGDTIDIKFTTRRFSTGAPFTLAGTPAVAAYVGNSVTEITAGITLTVDFDARTGLNNVRVVASSGNGFATATNVSLVITAGTVDSVSVVGEEVGSFSIENRSAVMPTTAGRTLDVSAGGEAGVDWANVGSPTTTVNLSGTTTNVVNTATAVTTVNGLAANVITSTAIAGDAITAAKIANGAIDAATFAAGAIDAAAIADGAIDAATFAAGAINAAAIAADAIGASELAADAVAEIADAIWDEATLGHTTAGTFGEQCKTDIDEILTDTGTTLDGRIPAALVSGRMDSSVGAMAANTMTAAALAADAVTEIQAGLSTLTAVQVNAEVVDALNVDTYAEPGQGAPAATTTLVSKIGYLYKFMRNRITQTSTTLSVYADDAITVDQKATVSDNGTTYDRGEIASGP